MEAAGAGSFDQAEADRLNELVLAKGDLLRQCKLDVKAGTAQKEEIQPLVLELQIVKAEYFDLTGQQWLSGKEDDKKKPHKKKVYALQPPPPPSAFSPYEPRDFFYFEILHKSKKPGSRARCGRLVTPHGTVMTPAFVAVGTNAALKAVDNVQSAATGQQLMFCNTYHLMVNPGEEVISAAGGLHKFMNRTGPLLTDSGGFQVFSLGTVRDGESADGDELKSRKVREGQDATLLSISEEGVKFKSYFDSHIIDLTPETSVRAQKAFGADIIIPLDELPPFHITPQRLKESVYLSHRWMARSLQEHLKDVKQQAMYGVVHGGTDRELRKLSAEYLGSLPFDGFAVGGSLGKNRDEMIELLEYLMPLLAEEKPVHLLGIGDEESLSRAVPHGIDTADCVWATRNARHGQLFLCGGKTINIHSGKFAKDFGPIDPDFETVPHSRAYIHHLFKAREPLFATLASQHNLFYMNKLMADLREKIMNDEI